MKHKQNGFGHLGVITIIVVLAVIGLVGWRVLKHQSTTSTTAGFDFQACLKEHQKPGQDPHIANDACITLQNQYNAVHRSAQPAATSSSKQPVGQQLSNNQCSGSGAGTLTHSAMNASDFQFIIPYGLLAGAHVTPIDHQYYSVNPSSAKDAYPVYAMGDAKLVYIEHRTASVGNDGGQPTSQWRLIFSHSCTWFYYYDLLTSLSSNLQKQFNAHKNPQGTSASVNISVKAGDVIGRIGGETLDFAVWDMTKPLTGFVNASDYKSELWKVYTANPLNYESSSLKSFMLSRSPRTVQPISGKLDEDIDGTLQGSWFAQGTNFYAGSDPAKYWVGHLAFVPDLYDPSHFWVSMGDYNGQATQYNAKGNTPQPANVNQSTGLVKYQLVQDSYVTASGTPWDQTYFTKGPKLSDSSSVKGTVLVQLTGKRTLKFEAFPGKTAEQVHDFDSGAKTYTR